MCVNCYDARVLCTSMSTLWDSTVLLNDNTYKPIITAKNHTRISSGTNLFIVYTNRVQIS